jgi:hypothetical protein
MVVQETGRELQVGEDLQEMEETGIGALAGSHLRTVVRVEIQLQSLQEVSAVVEEHTATPVVEPVAEAIPVEQVATKVRQMAQAVGVVHIILERISLIFQH